MAKLEHPALYVEQVPTPRRIEPAPTSVAALVGPATEGPLHRPVPVAGVAEFRRVFGGAGSPLEASVGDFVANGGRSALAVRATDLSSSVSALESADPFQLLVVSPALLGDGAGGVGSWETVHRLCERRRAFLVADSPDGRLPAGLGGNAAAYYPALTSSTGAVRPSSAAVAGVIARTDHEHGVWRSPAGTDAVVIGAAGLTEAMSEARVAVVAAERVNALRELPGGATVVWGARTASADPEWKYVAVRRLALFLESSLDAGLRWAVFESDEEPLWARVRSAVEDFLLDLWRGGAFQGATPAEAYFVRCDRSTMTQADLDSGTLVMLVGFAPLRPAEYVVLRLALATADAR